jgi:hypothetical protein
VFFPWKVFWENRFWTFINVHFSFSEKSFPKIHVFAA